MIEIENAVIDSVSQMLKKRFKLKADAIRSVHLNTPPCFPCVMIYESSNSTLEATCDEQGEHHINVRYTVEVYTNDATGKKQKAKEIASAIDDHLIALGFFRGSKQYTFGTNESTVFVITSSYRGVVGESYSGAANEVMIYRR